MRWGGLVRINLGYVALGLGFGAKAVFIRDVED